MWERTGSGTVATLDFGDGSRRLAGAILLVVGKPTGVATATSEPRVPPPRSRRGHFVKPLGGDNDSP